MTALHEDAAHFLHALPERAASAVGPTVPIDLVEVAARKTSRRQAEAARRVDDVKEGGPTSRLTRLTNLLADAL